MIMDIEKNPVIEMLQEMILIFQASLANTTDYALRDRLRTYIRVLNVIALWLR